jgi:hypothetical protein
MQECRMRECGNAGMQNFKRLVDPNPEPNTLYLISYNQGIETTRFAKKKIRNRKIEKFIRKSKIVIRKLR